MCWGDKKIVNWKGVNQNSNSLKLIEIKGLIFNRAVWEKIDKFLSFISKKTSFGIY